MKERLMKRPGIMGIVFLKKLVDLRIKLSIISVTAP